MLVFNRWPGDQVVLSNGMTLKVVEIRGGWVRFAIEAPDQVHLLRADLACRHAGPPDADYDPSSPGWHTGAE
jgi:carbon storage regulator CsrA